MKNLVKLFTVIALLAVGLSASAQGGNGSTEALAKEVALNSVRSFTVDLHATSNYAWTIENASGGTVVTSTTDLTAGDSNKNVFFVKWIAEGNYKVTLVESTKTTNCSDVKVNKKEFYIKVVANDFSVTPSWFEGKVVQSDNTCAVNGDNTLKFKVTKSGGKTGAWNFKYKISKSYDSNNYSEIVAETTVNYTSVGDEIVSVTTPINLGYAQCQIKFEVIDARDGYNTPANVLPVEIIAVVNQIPVTGDIVID